MPIPILPHAVIFVLLELVLALGMLSQLLLVRMNNCFVVSGKHCFLEVIHHL